MKQMLKTTLSCTLGIAVLVWLTNSVRAQEGAGDVVYVPTPHDVVDKMLELAKVTKTDVVYDLGCGDGRFVVMAARQFGARGVGIDIDAERIKEARDAEQIRLENRVQYHKAADYGSATS